MTDSDLLTHVTDSSFETEVLNADKPTMVDFWAPWCAPCLAAGPIIEELAQRYKDKLKVAKVNVDDNPGIASNLGIRSIPTIMIFKDGKMHDSLVGLAPKDRLEAFVKKVL